ncbi:hypothetical protein pb186bvf_008166 [Paramecium bursaria]
MLIQTSYFNSQEILIFTIQIIKHEFNKIKNEETSYFLFVIFQNFNTQTLYYTKELYKKNILFLLIDKKLFHYIIQKGRACQQINFFQVKLIYSDQQNQIKQTTLQSVQKCNYSIICMKKQAVFVFQSLNHLNHLLKFINTTLMLCIRYFPYKRFFTVSDISKLYEFKRRLFGKIRLKIYLFFQIRMKKPISLQSFMLISSNSQSLIFFYFLINIIYQYIKIFQFADQLEMISYVQLKLKSMSILITKV